MTSEQIAKFQAIWDQTDDERSEELQEAKKVYDRFNPLRANIYKAREVLEDITLAPSDILAAHTNLKDLVTQQEADRPAYDVAYKLIMNRGDSSKWDALKALAGSSCIFNTDGNEITLDFIGLTIGFYENAENGMHIYYEDLEDDSYCDGDDE